MRKQFQKTNDSVNVSRESLESLFENIQLILEDSGWRKTADSIFGEEKDKYTHDELLKDSLAAYRKYPAYKHIIELNKAFVLGAEGFSHPVSKNPLIQYVIDYVVDHVENQRTFVGYRAQQRIIEQKDLTGEVFFKVYIHTLTGETIIRIERDTSKIISIITEPGDVDLTQFYEYKETRREYDEKTKKTTEKSAVILIPDIRYSDTKRIEKLGATSSDKSVRVFGFLATFGNAAEKDGRGYPPYYAIIKYLSAHRTVAEDAATMLKALSRFAWKKKFKNDMNSTQMTGLKNLAKTFNDDLTIRNVPAATGSTLLEGQSVENQQVEVKHNASAFWETARILMQQIASGSDKAEHYFGNPDNANLATATSMELPMMKDFQRQQGEFCEIIETILKFVISKIIAIKGVNFIKQKAKENDYDLPSDTETMRKFEAELNSVSAATLDLTVTLPELLDKQVSALILSIINAYNAGLMSDIDASFMIYTLLGSKNVDDRMSDIYGDDYKGNLGAGDDDAASKDNLKKMSDLIDKNKDREPKGDDDAGNNDATKK